MLPPPPSSSLSLPSLLPSPQVLQDNEGVDLPGLDLEPADKTTGKVQERVLAVSSTVRTNFGIQSQLALTTYRCVCVCDNCVCACVTTALFLQIN